MTRALRCVEQLKHVLSIQTTTPQSTPKAGLNAISSTVAKSRVVTSELASIIQETNDTERLEELLNVNDQLLNLLKKVPGLRKPILGLDVAFNNNNIHVPIDGKLDGTPRINGRPSDCGEESSEASSVEGFEESPTTPRIDKGKGKAEPEPEEPEKVLSPRIRISDSEDEDEDGIPYEEAVEVVGASPTDRLVCFFLRPNVLSVGDLFFCQLDLVSGWQRKERSLGRERCYWVLQKWKVNMLGRSYGKK
jgi:protein phosphatase 1 regulatory subunit 37